MLLTHIDGMMNTQAYWPIALLLAYTNDSGFLVGLDEVLWWDEINQTAVSDIV